jgi:plasmid stabilization system protein ParE
MYQLRILQNAREDMQKSADWYNEQQSGLWERFLLHVIETFKLIEVNPLHYEEKFSREFRFARVAVFPYVIVFKIKKHLVVINAVFHTSRNPKKNF